MSTDSVKGLVDLAGAVTGVGVDKARDALRTLLTVALEAIDNPSAVMSHLAEGTRTSAAQASETVAEVTDSAAEMIRSEIDRAAARFGFVREEELAALRARVQRLEATVASASTSQPKTADSAKSSRASTTKKSSTAQTSRAKKVAKAND
jgi:hypothetical protein